MNRLLPAIALIIATACAAGCGSPARERSAAPSAPPRYVDLTHELSSDSIFWPTGETFRLEKVADGITEKGYYYASNRFSGNEHGGTHIDAPVHFAQGHWTVDQIPLESLIGNAIVVDVSAASSSNADYQVSVADFAAWEKAHQAIEPGTIVLIRTDFSKRWPDAAKMANKDSQGVAHYPGWSLPALKYLYEERKVTASGHETTDTDPGLATTKDDYSLEAYILGLNHYQIELLTNLDQVPEFGAVVVVSFPKPKGGSGFPARVFAILP